MEDAKNKITNYLGGNRNPGLMIFNYKGYLFILTLLFAIACKKEDVNNDIPPEGWDQKDSILVAISKVPDGTYRDLIYDIQGRLIAINDPSDPTNDYSLHYDSLGKLSSIQGFFRFYKFNNELSDERIDHLEYSIWNGDTVFVLGYDI